MGFFEGIIFICLSVACAVQDADGALPVPSVRLTSQWSEIYPSEQAKLKCDVDSSDSWSVNWYKNDIELQKTDSGLLFSGDGSELTLTAASQEQSGKYSCKGIHKIQSNITQFSNSVQLTIANQLKPSLSYNLISQKIFDGESVSFTCSIAAAPSSCEYVFYLRDSPIQKSAHNGLTISPAKETDTGAYYCAVKRGTMTVSSPSNTLSLEVQAVPVPTVKLRSAWFDVIVNEVVLLACESVGNDWSFSWFKKGIQISQNSDVFNIKDHGAQLHIASKSKDDEGQYTCKAHHNTRPVSSPESTPIRITVHDTPNSTLTKRPPYNQMYVGEIVSFSCQVNILTGWIYKWYKDDIEFNSGQTINITLGLSDGGQYSCKATRGRDTTTASSDKISQVVYAVPIPSVNLLSPWSDVFANEIVTLGCEYGITEWSFSWFKGETPITPDGNLIITKEGANLQILSASKGHEGGYSCKAQHKTRPVHSEKSPPHIIRVYENTPKPTMTKDPVYNPMYVGETVKFACSVDVATGWEFKWFADDKEIDFNNNIIISLNSPAEVSYYCKAKRGDRTLTGSSDKIRLKVLEIPVPLVKPLTEWLDVFPSETVELSCGMASGPSDWTYHWYKDDEKISREANTILTITSAAVLDKGQYKCKGILRSRPLPSPFSSGLNLTVYDKMPVPVLIQDPDYSILFPREPLSFHCHINVSTGWEFVWYNDSKQLNGNQKQYSLSTPDTTHSGSYKCKAKRGKNHTFSTVLSQAKKVEIRKDMPVPVMTQVPNVQKVYIGEPLIFRCALNISSDWVYHWYKDGKELSVVNDSYRIIRPVHADSGRYKCMAVRRKTTETDSLSKQIEISDIPVPSVKPLTQWLDVFPTEIVKLGCGMASGASDWTYEWHKDGRSMDTNVILDKDGATLTIHSSVSHIGEYSCRGKLKNRPVQSNNSTGMGLKVYEAKPSAKLDQNPEYDDFYTEDSVSFSCGVMVSSGWEYLWFKNNHHMASGQNHTIGHLQISHSGEYKCQTKRSKGDTVFYSGHSRTVKLEVKERPSVGIILLTGWSEVFSTDSLMLKCALKDEDTWGDWDFKWFKGDEEITESFSEKHKITPQNDPDQSQYMCQGIRNGTLSYTKRSEHFKTNNLLLKRRVLLSISGCLVFGICAVFFGCIILRVFRKPVVEHDKHEETNLFLTMAELKERCDVPCTLVEYVTDEDMKELSKDAAEETENGTVCSELTPLPITSKEDDAAPSESNNATCNGEMVSFKQ